MTAEAAMALTPAPALHTYCLAHGQGGTWPRLKRPCVRGFHRQEQKGASHDGGPTEARS